MKGMFIVFEGMTGSGKKTHIKLIEKKLKNLGKEVTIIGFPNFETEIARLTKRVQLDPFTLSLIYAADRSQYQERIKALLEKGNIVISDRYSYSNFVYQSVKGVPLDWLIEIEKNVIKPSIVILVDVPVEMSMKRVQQANIEDFTKHEILERLQREKEFLEKIRESYLFLAKKDKEAKWFIIDGTKDLSENQEQIWNIIKTELGV
jgi:dTMP kinase